MPMKLEIKLDPWADYPMFMRSTAGYRGGAFEWLQRWQPVAAATGGRFVITDQQEIRRCYRYAQYCEGTWEKQFRAALRQAVLTGEDDEPTQPEMF